MEQYSNGVIIVQFLVVAYLSAGMKVCCLTSAETSRPLLQSVCSSAPPLLSPFSPNDMKTKHHAQAHKEVSTILLVVTVCLWSVTEQCRGAVPQE